MDLDGNNVSGEIAEKRDVFLKAEREYLVELKKDPQKRELIRHLNRYSASDLSKEAEKRINGIENGEVKVENLETVEGEIVLLYAAIEDKIRELVKERTCEKKPKQREDDWELGL